jgi:hypothetical protein
VQEVAVADIRQYIAQDMDVGMEDVRRCVSDCAVHGGIHAGVKARLFSQKLHGDASLVEHLLEV